MWHRFVLEWSHTIFFSVGLNLLSRFRCRGNRIVFLLLIIMAFYFRPDHYCAFAVYFCFAFLFLRVRPGEVRSFQSHFCEQKILQLIQVFFYYVWLVVSLISFIMTCCSKMLWWWWGRYDDTLIGDGKIKCTFMHCMLISLWLCVDGNDFCVKCKSFLLVHQKVSTDYFQTRTWI